MKKSALIGLSVVLLFPLTAASYDTSTHAALTREAYDQSTFQKTGQGKLDLLTRLGVSAYGGNLGNAYLDMTSEGTVFARHNNPGTGGWTGDRGFTEDKFDDANRRLRKADLPTPAFQSPTGWLMVGSIREDDFKYNKGIREGENPPQDDPSGNINRVFNHFYDPYRDIPLQALGLSWIADNQGVKTPEWAVEGKDKSGQHRNYYSIKAAKEAMFRAATLRTLENGQLKPLPTPDPSGFGTTGLQMGELFKVSESEELQRRAYWATVFKALGHALHLLHDMGQPQHVRNDSHSGALCIPDINGNISDRCAGGQDSFYEKYIESRVKGENTFVLSKRFFERNEPGDVTSPTTESKPLTYVDSLNPYPIPSFNGYYDYYRSEGKTGDASYSGTGLANYTNMGFYSAGTNLGAYSPYPYPPRDYNALTQHHILPEEVKGMNGELIKDNEAYVTLLRYPVLDRFDPGKTEPNVALTGYSVFDQFLRDKGKEPVYSLNHYNYDAKADLLIPRAVSYSAGLIDYFFRGKMEISLPKEGVYSVVDHAQFTDTDPINDFKGFGKIKLKLKNTTKDVETASGESYPQTMSDGILVATLKFYRNKDYTDDLNGELSEGVTLADAYRKGTDKEEMILSEPIALSGLAPGEDIELTFNFQKELPINAWTPVRLSVVFRGKLGDEEDAVIVSEKTISSPIFFAAYNELDYINLNQTCYTKEQIIGNDALWGLLRADCKKSLSPSEPREFSDLCKKDVMNVAIDFGGVDSNLSIHWINEEGTLQARRFGRVAFLVDDEETHLSVFATSYQGNYGSVVFSYEDQAGYYFVYSDYRGISAYGGIRYIMNGRSQFGGGVCTNGFMPGHPTLLQGEERKPVPATEIIGWGP